MNKNLTGACDLIIQEAVKRATQTNKQLDDCVADVLSDLIYEVDMAFYEKKPCSNNLNPTETVNFMQGLAKEINEYISNTKVEISRIGNTSYNNTYWMNELNKKNISNSHKVPQLIGKNICPLCKASGTQGLNEFYCFNKQCRNYKI